MIQLYLLSALSVVFFLNFSDGARILGIAGLPSYSHQLFYRPIWLELAKRGHNLTLLITDPIKDAPSNIRQIDWHFTYDIRVKKHNTTTKMMENNFNALKILSDLGKMMDDVVNEELSHPEVQSLIENESEHFDLVVMEFIPLIYSAFSVRFKCPYITIFSADVTNFYKQAVGNPMHPVLYPEMFVHPQYDLNFFQRLTSTFYQIYFFYSEILSKSEKQDLVIRKHFGEGYPPLNEIIRNVSMVFVNSHPIFNVKPLGPGFVRIGGGLHMKEKQDLPREVEEFLDGDREVIYFSLGTNVKSQNIPKDFLKTALDTFKELPYKIIWKLDIDIPEMPSNVKIFRWLPQQDVLRHKNVKLFITQCGAQSLEEAIIAEVPMLAIPFVSDQKMNSFHIVNQGLGIEIDKNIMTKDILRAAIFEMMTNSRYKNKAKELAILLSDQPMSSLEKAIWWTEYVIRHKGAKHFWHPNLDLPFYQYFLLDVLGFVLLLLVIATYLLYKMFDLFLAKFKTTKKEKTS